MMRTCDGSDESLVMYIDLNGERVEDPTFGIMAIPCDCGMVFDDADALVIWPHLAVGPTVVINDLPDIMGLF